MSRGKFFFNSTLHTLNDCQVAAQNIPRDSIRVKSLWKHERAKTLRKNALHLYEFYQRLTKAMVKDREQGFLPE